jgi:hypothetical protein
MISIELVSNLSRAQCIERLRERVGNRYAMHRSFFGRVTDTAFWVEQRLGYRNSFKTRLRANLVEGVKGTRIRCQVGVQPLVFWFMVLWFSAVFSALLFDLVTSSGSIAAPLLQMLVCGAALVAVGRFLARNEQKALIDFVRNSLDAHIAGENLAVPTVS